MKRNLNARIEKRQQHAIGNAQVASRRILTGRLVLTGPDSGLAGTVKLIGDSLAAFGLTREQAQVTLDEYCNDHPHHIITSSRGQ